MVSAWVCLSWGIFLNSLIWLVCLTYSFHINLSSKQYWRILLLLLSQKLPIPLKENSVEHTFKNSSLQETNFIGMKLGPPSY